MPVVLIFKDLSFFGQSSLNLRRMALNLRPIFCHYLQSSINLRSIFVALTTCQQQKQNTTHNGAPANDNSDDELMDDKQRNLSSKEKDKNE